MRHRIHFTAGLLTILIVSCGRPDALKPDDYRAWIGTEESGLFKMRKINNVEIRARYIPAAYLAYQEIESQPGASYDSILKAYQCGLTFQIDLQADTQDKRYGNLMFYGVPDQPSLSERTRFLSFDIDNFITLTCNGELYAPVLSNFDGYNPLANKISFRVVFDIPQHTCGTFDDHFKELQVTFDDPYWELGTSNFEFTKKTLTDIPKLKFK